MTTLRTKPQTQKKERKERFFFLLFLSLLIHATLIILIAILFAERAAQKPEPPPEPAVPEVILEISPPERPFVEAKEISDKASEKASFQSDQNSKAASELPATGSAPFATQQGVTQTDLELQNQRYTPGEHPASSAGNPSPPAPPVQPDTQKSKTSSTPAPSASPLPTPITTPPPPNSVKLLELPQAQSTPQPTHTPVPQSTTTPSSQPGQLGANKGYQPETRQTVISGSISNRGRSSVAAEATPIGRYKKKMSTAIGSLWYYKVNELMGLISIGTVQVQFTITSSGEIKNLRVLSSNSNSSLTECTLESIQKAKIPPIPPDVAATLQNGCLEIDYSFTIY